jgi:hypothetical protein
MSGLTDQQIILIFNGGGSNGKGVLTDILSSLFGEKLWVSLNSSILDANGAKEGANQATPEKAKLFMAHIALINEVGINCHFGEEFKKLVDSGNAITARHLNANPFTFELRAQFIITCNELPVVDGQSESYWRRLMIYPFFNYYESLNSAFYNPKKHKPKDTDKAKKIKMDLPGVFRWLLIGSVKYHQNGGLPKTPSDCEYAKEQFRGESDWTTLFVPSPGKTNFIAFCDIQEAIQNKTGVAKTKNKVIKQRLFDKFNDGKPVIGDFRGKSIKDGEFGSSRNSGIKLEIMFAQTTEVVESDAPPNSYAHSSFNHPEKCVIDKNSSSDDEDDEHNELDD